MGVNCRGLQCNIGALLEAACGPTGGQEAPGTTALGGPHAAVGFAPRNPSEEDAPELAGGAPMES